MASVALLKAGLLSRKGGARPMRTPGKESRDHGQGQITWLPSARDWPRLTPTPAGAPQTNGRAGAGGPAKRVRVSLRVTRDLHGRLKGLSAATERTQQSILVQALNEYLERHEEHMEHAGDRRSPIPD